MTAIHQVLLHMLGDIPECFHSVFHFGSSLYSDLPGDVDLLLIYSDCYQISYIVEQRNKLLTALVDEFEGLIIDLVTLSDEELAMTGFLQKTKCVSIRTAWTLCRLKAPPFLDPDSS